MMKRWLGILLCYLLFTSWSLIVNAETVSTATTSDVMQQTSMLVEKHAAKIFYDSGATGMALVVVDDNGQVVTRFYGETSPGNGIRPTERSLIRIASLTKPMTSEVMLKLEQQGKLKVTDPLQKYLTVRVPKVAPAIPIRLYHLATHTSGIPREQPGRPQKATVFTWPTRIERLQWLRRAKLTTIPGDKASYSNLAYDLLADALAKAGGKTYPRLLQDLITSPLGMTDTTYSPTAEQCARLMKGKGAGPCKSAVAAIGSGGVYSTPYDIQLWMQKALLNKHNEQLQQQYKMYFKRADLNGIKGMDVAGIADELGLGWVYMHSKEGRVAMIQKTGGGGGFMTYMSLLPEKNIGVFVVVTRGETSRFKNMSNEVNRLATTLAKN